MRSFKEKGREIVRAFLGKSTTEAIATSEGGYEYNLFWANTQVLKAAIYANPPNVLVKREFDDFQDDVARVASIIMERLLSQDLCLPKGVLHDNIARAVGDRLLAGIGQTWLRYQPTIEKVEINKEPLALAEQAEEQTGTGEKIISRSPQSVHIEVIKDEQALVDYVYWEDFLYSPARNWNEVWWVARRCWMTRHEVESKFGAKIAKTLNYGSVRATARSQTSVGSEDPANLRERKAEVFEIWCKKTEKIHFFSKGEQEPFAESDDELEIPGFFPCPEPLMANVTSTNFLPRADYTMVKAQYLRVETLQARISLVEEAIRVAGVYDKNSPELKSLLSNTTQNLMVAVDNWAMFAEKGGIKGSIDWFPIEQVVNTLESLRGQMLGAQQQLYELTGISDIMRGTTSPRETLGAQQMKAQYSSSRLQYLQGEVANFVQQTLRIRGAIIAKHFQPEVMIKRSNIMLTPDGELAQQAVALLKDEWEACYRIEILSDTMAIPDYNAERQGRIEMITALGQFVGMVMPLIQMDPGTGTVMMQIMKWGVAGFRSGQEIEGILDKAVKQLEKKLQQPKPPAPPDPAVVKAQAEVKAMQEKAKIEAQSEQAKAQREQAKAQSEIQSRMAKTQAEVMDQQRQTAANAAENAAQIEAAAMKTQADIEQGWAKTNAQIAQMRAKENAKPKADDK